MALPLRQRYPHPSDSDATLRELITSLALRIETAQDALDAFWLVHCGLLAPLSRHLAPEHVKQLGHGNVLVWIDAHASSLTDVRSSSFILVLDVSKAQASLMLLRTSMMGASGAIRCSVT